MAFDAKEAFLAYGISCDKPVLINSERTDEIRMNFIADKKYVLQVSSNEIFSEQRVELMNKLIERYNEFGFVSPKYLKAEDGKYIHIVSNLYCMVHEYANEKLLYECDDVSYIDINNQIYEYLGKYSEQYKGKEILPFRTTYSVFDLSPLDTEVDEMQANFLKLTQSLQKAGFLDLKNKLVKYNETIREELRQIYKKLPRCNYQGNINSRNLLIRDKKLVGLIDFTQFGSEVIVNYIANETKPEISSDDFYEYSANEIFSKMIKEHKANMAIAFKNYKMTLEEKKALDLYCKLIHLFGFSYFQVYNHVIGTKYRNKATSLLYMLMM